MKDAAGNSGPNPNYTIIEVWSSNLEEEFRKIRKIVQKYPYVAMVSTIGQSLRIKFEKICRVGYRIPGRGC